MKPKIKHKYKVGEWVYCLIVDVYITQLYGIEKLEIRELSEHKTFPDIVEPTYLVVGDDEEKFWIKERDVSKYKKPLIDKIIKYLK